MKNDATLQALNERARPTALAEERVLPVHDALTPLLPKGLVRGSSVQVVGGPGKPGGTSLALALLIEPSRMGSWVAVLGMPSLGLTAAAGFGVNLHKLVLISQPEPKDWATVVATLLEGFEVVVARPTAPVRPPDARRLAARARERGVVLIRQGAPGLWPEGADVSLAVTAATWTWAGDRGRDLDDGSRGHLLARRATVEASGRRGAAQPRAVDLWLPGANGQLAAADPMAEVHPFARRPDLELHPAGTGRRGVAVRALPSHGRGQGFEPAEVGADAGSAVAAARDDGRAPAVGSVAAEDGCHPQSPAEVHPLVGAGRAPAAVGFEAADVRPLGRSGSGSGSGSDAADARARRRRAARRRHGAGASTTAG